MDRILNRTVQTAQIATTLGTEILTDLEYADDVAPLSEMLAVLITAKGIMHEKASLFGMEINWSKTKIQAVGIQDCPITVQVVGNDVEVVERFTYFGTQISKDGSCESEISRHIAITRDCQSPAAPYLAFEHHGYDQGTAAERVCAPSPPLRS